MLMASENIVCACPGIITDASKFLHLCKKMIWELLRFEKSSVVAFTRKLPHWEMK